jgi:hypothetical protein
MVLRVKYSFKITSSPMRRKDKREIFTHKFLQDSMKNIVEREPAELLK